MAELNLKKYNLDKKKLRILVNVFYALQMQRIALSSNLLELYKMNHFDDILPLEIEYGDITAEEIIVELEASEIIKNLCLEFKTLVAANKKITAKTDFDRLKEISDYSMYTLVKQYSNALESEKEVLKAIDIELDRMPIYTEYLKNIKGVGPTMAGVIVSYLDIHIAVTPSKFTAYCGIDVVLSEVDGEVVGRGRGLFPEHMVERVYTKRDGTEGTKQSASFSPFVKSKMLGVLVGSLIINSDHYSHMYLGYKNRKQNEVPPKWKTKSHLDKMARRWLLQQFLKDLWCVWRKLEQLPFRPTYEAEKLGIVHSAPTLPELTERRKSKKQLAAIAEAAAVK